MRGFLIGWLAAFTCIGIIAVAISTMIGPSTPPPPTPVPKRATVQSSEPFTQRAAVEVVGARFGTSPAAERLRNELRQGARVTYHSPQHWTVTWGNASWTAHGPGRYAEPDNDAARQREADAATGS